MVDKAIVGALLGLNISGDRRALTAVGDPLAVAINVAFGGVGGARVRGFGGVRCRIGRAVGLCLTGCLTSCLASCLGLRGFAVVAGTVACQEGEEAKCGVATHAGDCTSSPLRTRTPAKRSPRIVGQARLAGLGAERLVVAPRQLRRSGLAPAKRSPRIVGACSRSITTSPLRTRTRQG